MTKVPENGMLRRIISMIGPTITIPVLGNDCLVIGQDRDTAIRVLSEPGVADALLRLPKSVKIQMGGNPMGWSKEDVNEIKVLRKRVIKERDELTAMVALMRVLLDAVHADSGPAA